MTLLQSNPAKIPSITKRILSIIVTLLAVISSFDMPQALAASLLSSEQSEPQTVVAPSMRLAKQPILINPVEPEQPTKLFELTIPERPTYLSIDVSEPILIDRLEARVDGKTVASFDSNGIFDVDWNRPTKPTTIPLSIVENIEISPSTTLAIWATPSKMGVPGKTVDIKLHRITFTNGEVEYTEAQEWVKYPFGLLLRDKGWDGAAGYRIPALAKTNKGTLLAIYDARWNGLSDLPADIDVMCNRSEDGGKTWGPMTTVMDLTGDDPKSEGIGDPAVLVDPNTGRIWVAGIWGHGGRGVWNSEPGLRFGSSPRFVLTYSDDDGKTWSAPRDITNEAAPERNWRHFFQGPGMGISLRDGTLVFPAQYMDENKAWYSTIIWSKDSGETWNVGTGAHKDTCEAQVVELNDGSIMLNMRHFTERARSVAITKDLGETWIEHPTSGHALIEPVCQASLLKVRAVADGDSDNLLAFLNPNSKTNRKDLTLKLSIDEGETWTLQTVIYAPSSFGYSAMTKLDNNSIGLLYETSGGLIFQIVDLNDVLNQPKGKDHH